MFPKNQRITSREFLEIMKRGKNYHFPLFSLCQVSVYEKSCFAVVASKKVSKKAVIRNRNKRRVREAFKKLLKKPFSGALIVFIKKDLSSLSYSSLIEELKVVISKI